jgi:hypothetical protein
VFHEFLWSVLTVQDREVGEDATVRVVKTQALSFKKHKKREKKYNRCQKCASTRGERGGEYHLLFMRNLPSIGIEISL